MAAILVTVAGNVLDATKFRSLPVTFRDRMSPIRSLFASSRGTSPTIYSAQTYLFRRSSSRTSMSGLLIPTISSLRVPPHPPPNPSGRFVHCPILLSVSTWRGEADDRSPRYLQPAPSATPNCYHIWRVHCLVWRRLSSPWTADFFRGPPDRETNQYINMFVMATTKHRVSECMLLSRQTLLSMLYSVLVLYSGILNGPKQTCAVYTYGTTQRAIEHLRLKSK